MDTNKIIGYVLLVIGVLIILGSLWQTFAIFTGKTEPPQIFKEELGKDIKKPATPTDIQAQMQSAIEKLVPAGSVVGTLNMSAWLILAWILIMGGGQLATLGIKLVK